MKLSRILLAATCIALLIATGCVTGRGAGEAHGSARITSLEGSAEISRGAEGWEPAHLWQKVSSGDRARTGADGKINFRLAGHGGVLTLMPDSLVDFEQIGRADSSPSIVAVLNLREGRVVGDTLKLPEGARVQIKTRGGVHEIP